jgi:hypothetical protein
LLLDYRAQNSDRKRESQKIKDLQVIQRDFQEAIIPPHLKASIASSSLHFIKCIEDEQNVRTIFDPELRQIR